MTKNRDLILVGDSLFAEVAYEMFTHDSEYKVKAFAVERAYLRRSRLFGVPVVALEDAPALYPPDGHSFYAAIVSTQMNRLRKRLMDAMESLGYAPATYVSSAARVWPNAVIGSHCFIMEGNVVQPFTRIGNNVVLWSGNHLGHHSSIGNHSFVSSHVVISGNCRIGEYCFLGVNSCVANDVEISRDCFLNMGSVVTRHLAANQMVRGNPAMPYQEDTLGHFGLDHELG